MERAALREIIEPHERLRLRHRNVKGDVRDLESDDLRSGSRIGHRRGVVAGSERLREEDVAPGVDRARLCGEARDLRNSRGHTVRRRLAERGHVPLRIGVAVDAHRERVAIDRTRH